MKNEVLELLQDWEVESPDASREIIRCLVEYLAADKWWVRNSIRLQDKESLQELVKFLDKEES